MESFRLPKFPEHRQGSLAYMEALVRAGQGLVSSCFSPGAEQGQSQSQESAAKGQEKSHKSEPAPAAFPESWRAGKGNGGSRAGVGTALSSLGSQAAVLGLAEVCPDAQNRHKCAKDPPTEHFLCRYGSAPAGTRNPQRSLE